MQLWISIYQDFGRIITGLEDAHQPGILNYDQTMTSSIVQKINQAFSFIISDTAKIDIINMLKDDEQHLILTNHKTYINIPLIQALSHNIRQEFEISNDPSHRHTIVWPRVTYDPVFRMIASSLSNLLQTIPQTASIQQAFTRLQKIWYSQHQINQFKHECLMWFGRSYNNVLSKSWLIFLAPSGTTEPIDKQGKIILASDQELPGSMKLIERYATTWWSATIITTDENFETQQVIIHTHALTNTWLQDLLDNKWVMQTIADTAGWTVKDQKTITTMKQEWKVYQLPINQILQLFAI